MYAVPEELLNPFGRDINDFGLDTLVQDIFPDLLFIEVQNRCGSSSLLFEAPIRMSTKKGDDEMIAPGKLEVSTDLYVGESRSLAAKATPLLLLFAWLFVLGSQ